MTKIRHGILDAGGIANPDDIRRIAQIRLAQRLARAAAENAVTPVPMSPPQQRFNAIAQLLASQVAPGTPLTLLQKALAQRYSR